jgi:hypothetical protein
MHALAIAAAIPAAWTTIPDAPQHVPAWLMAASSAVVGVSGIVGRLVKQDAQQ